MFLLYLTAMEYQEENTQVPFFKKKSEIIPYINLCLCYTYTIIVMSVISQKKRSPWYPVENMRTYYRMGSNILMQIVRCQLLVIDE